MGKGAKYRDSEQCNILITKFFKAPQLGGLGGKIMEVKVLFFGVLSEVAGNAVKHYQDVKSVSDLKRRIQDDFPEITHYNFRISVNSTITDDDILLKSGDEIALLPPFAGG